MKHAIILATAIAAIGTCAHAGGAKALAPEPGSYAASIFVNATSGTCLNADGQQFAGELSFSGLNGSIDRLRVPLTGYGLAAVSVQTLTIKSGQGTTSLSGNLAWDGSGTGAQWSDTGTFTATVTEIGTHAFVMSISEAYGTCTEDLGISLVRVSADQ